MDTSRWFKIISYGEWITTKQRRTGYGIGSITRVVKNTAKVGVNKKILLLGKNESTYISFGLKNILGNLGKIRLIYIEFLSRNYNKWKDIVRA